MQDSLRKIPQVDKILSHPLCKNANKKVLKNIVVAIIDDMRKNITSKNLPQSQESSQDLIECVVCETLRRYESCTKATLVPVINATGVVLQTNLGRSIFHKRVVEEVAPLLCGYNNLEYDLDSGKRGERYVHVKNMLCAMFGLEDALVVNNNAAAVFLVLNTFAKDKECIISRGELVEIGGSFRMHEIMKSASARLIEVGATNRTRLSDYQDVLNCDTAMIVKAYKSNFHITGYTQEVGINDITALCEAHNKRNNCDVIDYYDFGSGNAVIEGEASLYEICKNLPSLISFSGDKLFGSAQCGIILGKRSLITRLKKNHLLRALRVDKVTLLLLQATLKRYINNALDEIPSIAMLRLNLDELRARAENLSSKIPAIFNPKIIETASLSGGGSMPDRKFQSIAIACHVESRKPIFLESLLRAQNLIARIEKNRVVLDMRTIQESEFARVIEIFHIIKKELP